MKLQNDFPLKPILLNELEQTSSKCVREKLRKTLFVLQYINIDKVKIFCVIHDKVVLLTRRCSEWKSSPKNVWKGFLTIRKRLSKDEFFTNCLAYRYRPNFFNWMPVFLEKVQTTGTNQNFIRFRYFSCCYLFVSL